MISAILGGMRLKRFAVAFGAAASVLLAGSSPGYAQTSANVAVIINDQSPASVQIGEHYARRRGIPSENVVRVSIEPADTITRQRYALDLEAPIARAFARSRLQDRVLYIVLTKGIPMRITGTVGLKGSSASVDSELTLLYRRMTGRAVPPQGPLDNPFFAGDDAGVPRAPFSHEDHDIYLVTRLDGFTVEDATKLIDRAQTPDPTGAIILDQRAHARSEIPDRWMAEAADAIRSSAVGRLVVLEDSAAAASQSGPALGYFSWGSTDPALRDRPVDLAFVPGSIAAMLGSTGAATFDPTPEATRPMAGDLVRAGASGVAAYVAEPYLQSSFRPQVLFPAYLSGLTLADAFYSALPHLSWQSVVIGDPLIRPFIRGPSTAVDAPVDPTTGVPAYFLARRLEVLRTELPGVPPAALQQAIASEMHQARDDRPGAIEALTRAAELAPAFAAVHLRLAVLHEEAGNATQAIEGYRRVLALEAHNVIALNNLAYALATKNGALDEGVELARKASALAPNDGTILDTLGWIEHLRGNDTEAAKLLRRAAQLAANRAEIRLHAAMVLAESGATAEARGHLDAATKLDPSLETRDDVKQLRERIRK